MQGNRYPVLSNFANMVRNNEFKIRSVRTINELDTWIFKGEAKRMDHMDGSHDDSITCLAMALFVMVYHYKKKEASKEMDSAILKAYFMGGGVNRKTSYDNEHKTMDPKNGLPFYKTNGYVSNEGLSGNYMWLFGK